jgi:hypothetical protein
MPPITIIVASKRPSRRASVGCDFDVDLELLMVAVLLIEKVLGKDDPRCHTNEHELLLV